MNCVVLQTVIKNHEMFVTFLRDISSFFANLVNLDNTQ